MRLHYVLLVALVMSWPSFARAGVVTDLTVTQVFDEIGATIEQAERSANTTVQQLGAQMKQSLAQVKKDFADVLEQRVDELSEEMQLQLRSVQLLADQTLASINSMPACVGNEVQFATAALREGMEASLSRLPLIAAGEPSILLVHEHDRRRPFVVRADPRPKLIVVRGVNLWSSQTMCSVDATLIPLTEPGPPVPLEILSRSSGEYVLRAGGGIATGAYEVKLEGVPEGPWWKLYSCQDPVSLSSIIRAVPLPKLAVEVKATPYCRRDDVYTYQCAGGLNAGSCKNGTESATKTCAFDRPGYSLQSFGLALDQHRGGASADRAGDDVVVSYYASQRGRMCQRGGGRSFWTLTMVGKKRVDPTLGNPIATAPFDIRASQDASFALDVSATGCDPVGWVIEGSARGGEDSVLKFGPVALDASGTFLVKTYPVVVSLEMPSGKGSAQLMASSCLD